MAGTRRKRNHPKGRLKGHELKRVHELLDQYDFCLPGHCVYKHKVTEKPDILRADPTPAACTRKEAEEAFHYYNFKKFEVYRKIMDGASYSSISRRLKYLNHIRWQLVQINTSLVFKFFAKNVNLREYESDTMMHLHHMVDSFNPKLKFAPSTFLYRGIINHAYRCYKGNVNQQNMKYVFASEMGRYPGEDDFQNAFDAQTADIESNEVLENVEFNENRARVRKLIESIEDPRDRKVIELRFFSTLTLEEIGRILNVSKERIRQLEGRALEQMRTKESRDRYHRIAENHRRSLLSHPHLVGS